MYPNQCQFQFLFPLSELPTIVPIPITESVPVVTPMDHLLELLMVVPLAAQFTITIILKRINSLEATKRNANEPR